MAASKFTVLIILFEILVDSSELACYYLFAVGNEPDANENAAYKENTMASLISIEERGGNQAAVCVDCGRWEYASSGKLIRHSSRCSTPNAQHGQVSAAEKLPAFRAPQTAQEVEDFVNSSTDDEIFDAYKRGWISMSDAMNQDT